jgi:undecaprenyl-diphosphatase
MELFEAIVLAIIQGITEWLPVSSSGHLAIMQHFFGLQENISYDVLLHFSSFIVILLIFYKDIKKILSNKKYLLFILIGTIPIVVVGLLIEPYIQDIFNNILLVGFMLLVTGLILFFTDKKPTKELDYKRSFWIGLFQALAILPGISRSGSTIGGALLLGIKKDEAIRFSFILALPTLLGAMLLNINDVATSLNSQMIIGFFVSLVVSYIFLQLLIDIVRKNGLKWFSYYCWTVGIIIILTAIN